MRKLKTQKGITLVALIITIVVLLILAVVAIGAAKDSNIVGYAQNAADSYETEKGKENQAIKDNEDLLNQYANGANGRESKVTYTKEGVPVPAGFKVVTGTKDTGLVIENETEGSQFVWVPATGFNPDGYTGHKEPDVVTGSGNQYDADPSNLEIAGCEENPKDEDNVLMADDFKVQLINEYKAMVASVNHYGGFYVGRYEVSINGEDAQSKEDGTNITSATAASADTWYGLYKLCKTYNTSSVKSSMIWGSQYDAMMTWMEVTDSSGVPGYNDSQNPGTEPLDVIRNVYDLYGSSYEWTLEALGTSVRCTRAGCFVLGASPSCKGGYFPTNDASTYGSRLTLYVEL